MLHLTSDSKSITLLKQTGPQNCVLFEEHLCELSYFWDMVRVPVHTPKYVFIQLLLSAGPETVLFNLDGLNMGMLGSGWSCLGLTSIPGSEETVDKGLRKRAMVAMNGWTYFANVIPRNPQFLNRVQIATNTFFNGTVEDPDSVNAFSANLFDAIMLYARTISSIDQSSGTLSAAEIVTALKLKTFEGMSGQIMLDSNGDLMGAVAAMNYVLDGDMMKNVELGVFDPARERYDVTAHPIWPGNTTRTPDYFSGAL